MNKVAEIWWMIRRACRDYWCLMRGRQLRMTLEDMEWEMERRYGIPRKHGVDG